MRYDVVIAGAGPAGTATAARLGQHGLAGRVLVLDRYGFPRDKPCGGALTGHADQAMAALDLALTVDHLACRTAEVRYGAFVRQVAMGRTVDVIRRRELDASLVEQVRARGVEVIEREGVIDYQVRGDRVVIATSRGRELEARVLVGADGAGSLVRKRLAGERAVPHRLFMQEIELPPGREPPTMLYDFSLMQRGLPGYLWLFPMSGRRVNVGLMQYPRTRATERRGGRALVELLREGLAGHGLELPARGARGWPVWGYAPRGRVSAPRVLTVGDAAGIDGLTGEGIGVAMEQAIVAGDLIAQGLAGDELGFAGYRAALRRAVVGRELALDRWLARLLYGGRGWREFLALVLYDREVLELYAARVAGTEVLANQKARLYRALGRHLFARRGRRRALAAAETPARLGDGDAPARPSRLLDRA